MKINEILDELELTGSYNTDRLIYENALYFYGSILMNGYNVRLEGRNVIYFGITLAPSSAGKDWANDQVLKILFNGNDRTYAQAMRESANVMFENDYPFSTGLQTGMTISLEGTKEGLFTVAQAQANSGFGSLNLIANEMGRIVSSSSDLIEKTKELFDGKYKAKTVKGSLEVNREVDIENIVCNMLMFGSPAGMNRESKDQIVELCKSGLYRRSFIINIEPCKRSLKENITPIKSRAWFDGYKPTETRLTVDQEAKLYIKQIKEELLNLGNENLYNDFIQADTAATNIVVNLASIICFLQKEEVVNIQHIQDAYDFFKRSRHTVNDVFKITTVHDTIYKLLKRGNQLARHELITLDPVLDVSKTKWDDGIDIVTEMCYVRNEYLNKIGSNVTKYCIEKLPINKLDKIKLSVTDDDGAYAINFKQYEIPFFGEGFSLESLLISNKSSFATCHFEASGKAKDGHRRAESFISGQNIVAFDIDEGMTLDEVIRLLVPYTYLIYTTKSHRTIKHGVMQGDRFRIILPTKTEYFVNAEQHKQMYENLSKILGVISYDVATRNVSRLWFLNKEGEVYKNEAELLDVTAALPSTEAEALVMPNIESIEDDDELDRRLKGTYKYFISNTNEGNRNTMVYRFAKMISEFGEDVEMHTEKLNAMISEPLKDSEIRTICRSAGSK
jgi:hypothetical protein